MEIDIKKYKKNLLEQINNEQQSLIKKLDETQDKEIEFFQYYTEHLNGGFIESILTMDYYDFIKAHIKTHCSEISFVEINDILESAKSVYGKEKIKEFIDFNATITTLSQTIKKCNQNINSKKRKRFLDRLELSENMQSIKEIKEKILRKHHVDLSPYIELYLKHPKVFDEAMSMIMAFSIVNILGKQYQQEIEFINQSERFPYQNKKGERRQVKKEFNSEISKTIKEKEIKEEFQFILNYASNLSSKEKRTKKQIRYKLNAYTEIKNWLAKDHKREISNIPQKIEQLSDTKLKNDLLCYIYTHNMNIYQEIEEKYKKCPENSINQYHLLLKQYGISLNDEQINIKIDIEEMEKILELATSIEITDPKLLVYILNYSSQEIVNHIKQLIISGYISITLIKNNIKVFTDNYPNLIKNINLLKNENLSISNILQLEELLIYDHNILKKNINHLKQYDLFPQILKTSQRSFMMEDCLEYKMDRVLELGLEDLLEEDLELLNLENESLKFLIILKRLNIPISSKEDLYMILTHQKTVMNTQNIDEYLFIATPNQIEVSSTNEKTKEEFTALLEQYPNTNRTYILNQVLISKNKVNRMISAIDHQKLTKKEQLDCIISGMILNPEEIENITNSIFQNNKHYTN